MSKADRAIRRARTIADLFDQRYRVPGTGIRFGLDALIGLIPVVGDSAGLAVGGYVILEAIRLRLGFGTVARMMLNVGIDFLIGLIPLADLILDVAYKANVRNAKLLEDAIEAKKGPPSSSDPPSED